MRSVRLARPLRSLTLRLTLPFLLVGVIGTVLVAALIALLLGSLLARTLSRPVRELTAATKGLASGHLKQRIAVRSRDEICELASAFNQMSAERSRRFSTLLTSGSSALSTDAVRSILREQGRA